MIRDLNKIIDKRLRESKRGLQVKKVIKKANKTKKVIILFDISL